MEAICQKIIQCIEKEYELKEQREIVAFGLQSALEIFINILISVLVLYQLQMFKEGAFFFCFFIPLRMYSGGYHADTYWRCLVFSVLTLIAVLKLSTLIHLTYLGLLVLVFIIAIGLLVLGPVVNAQRPVSHREYQRFKRKFKITLLFIILTAFVLTVLREKSLLNVLLMGMGLVLITLIMGKIKYKQCQS